MSDIDLNVINSDTLNKFKNIIEATPEVLNRRFIPKELTLIKGFNLCSNKVTILQETILRAIKAKTEDNKINRYLYLCLMNLILNYGDKFDLNAKWYGVGKSHRDANKLDTLQVLSDLDNYLLTKDEEITVIFTNAMIKFDLLNKNTVEKNKRLLINSCHYLWNDLTHLLLHNEDKLGVKLQDIEDKAFYLDNLFFRQSPAISKLGKMIKTEGKIFYLPVRASRRCPIIKKDLSFKGAIFQKDIKLDGTCFEGKVDFSGARFNDKVVLDCVSFQKEVDFTGSRFSEATFDSCDFKEVYTKRIQFKHIKGNLPGIEEIINIKNAVHDLINNCQNTKKIDDIKLLTFERAMKSLQEKHL